MPAGVQDFESSPLHAERARRESLWKELLTFDGARAVPPKFLKDRFISRGQRGVYVNLEKTRGIAGDNGIAVSFLHTGSAYGDDLSQDGVLYHYPHTSRPGHDKTEIYAAKLAFSTAIPIFVICAGPSSDTRTVHRGYIEDFDDDAEQFLVTFTSESLPPPPAVQGVPFNHIDDSNNEKWEKRRSRPNQQRFAFDVFKRYGVKCCVCDIAAPAVLQAAHIRSKKDKGSDDSLNGLPLCANHHLAYDAKMWAIEPGTTRIVSHPPASTLADLMITRIDLQHLRALPHETVIQDAWTSWK